jgi:SAM-dependent methyltransferase
MSVDKRSRAEPLVRAARKVARPLPSRPKAAVRKMYWFSRGFNHARRMDFPTHDGPQPTPASNDLRTYFEGVKSGPGIWKWTHYFDIYHRHFEKFRGSPVNVLEIGIYSGGSIGMWKAYFGPRCHVYGVDIEAACKIYEGEGVEVFIGDQADRAFWTRFKEKVPSLDVVIDDGGHRVDQQVATLEELLPHLRPGGVYLCEDIHRASSPFGLYISGLSQRLNGDDRPEANPDDNARRLVARASAFQGAIDSIHMYPFVVVIEKREAPVAEFVAPKHGTHWQPFLK